MNIKRLRPPPGCDDLALWLSGVINDAIRDAREAGLSKDESWRLVAGYARGEDPQGRSRYPKQTSGRLGDLIDPAPATIDELIARGTMYAAARAVSLLGRERAYDDPRYMVIRDFVAAADRPEPDAPEWRSYIGLRRELKRLGFELPKLAPGRLRG